MTELLLTWMTTWGPLAVALALLLGAAGLPIPTGVLVLAAGAFARQGLIDGGPALVLGLLGVVLGDSLSYALGRWAGGWVQRYVRHGRGVAWQKAQARFQRHGGPAVCVTRVLFTSLDVPTNLIAGSSHFAFRQFLAWDVAGRVGWLALYGGLGYLFYHQWQAISQAIGQYGLWLGAAVVVGVGVLLTTTAQRHKEPV